MPDTATLYSPWRHPVPGLVACTHLQKPSLCSRVVFFPAVRGRSTRGSPNRPTDLPVPLDETSQQGQWDRVRIKVRARARFKIRVTDVGALKRSLLSLCCEVFRLRAHCVQGTHPGSRCLQMRCRLAIFGNFSVWGCNSEAQTRRFFLARTKKRNGQKNRRGPGKPVKKPLPYPRGVVHALGSLTLHKPSPCLW